jgi:predicted DNA-binding antitoxin AbrB/MazE fold protein
MAATIHAFFENGRFRPVEPISLPDCSLVEIEVHACEEAADLLPVSEMQADSAVGGVFPRPAENENRS